MNKNNRFARRDGGIYVRQGLSSETLICSMIDVVSRIRINMPMAVPQTWLTLQFSDAEGEIKQALVLSSTVTGEQYWSLLGDLYQEGFVVTRGCEDLVRSWLLQQMEETYEFELCHSMPPNPVYLSSDRVGWGGLYHRFNQDIARQGR